MRLNSPAKGRFNTLNYEGAPAYKYIDSRMELYTRVASCLLGEPQFYRSGETQVEGLRECVEHVGDPEFILSLAAFARNELKLRTVPIFLLVEACRMAPPGMIRKYVPRIIRRADEPAEALAYYISRYGRTFDRSFLKGLADALPQFEEYHLAKYDRDGQVKLRDVFRIVRPKPKSAEQSRLWRKAVRGELETPRTWETIVSREGSSREAWEEALEVMPPLALLRNLRNLEEHGVNLAPVYEKLSDPIYVARTKFLPFRWLAAYQAVNDRMLKSILSQAVDGAIQNMPHLGGRTLILIDNSRSMRNPLSAHSTMLISQVASLLGAMADRICDSARIMVFASKAEWVDLPADVPTLTKADMISRVDVGGSTYAYKCFEKINNNNEGESKKFDRVILLSDMQCYGEEKWGNTVLLRQEFLKYRRHHPEVKLYSVDLQGYGTAQFLPGDGVALLGGFSERIIELIVRLEEDPNAVFQAIEEYKAC